MPNYLDHLDIIDDNNVIPVMLMDRETSALANHNKLEIGTLDELETTDKSSLVNAINELTNNVVYVPSDALDLDNTGSNDCSSTLANLDDNVGLKAGIYRIANSVTITKQLVFAEGAVLSIDSGVTVTIKGNILAGRYQIFTGGTVVGTGIGYPEWFGAIANDTVDCTNAIQKCINAFNVTLLGIGNYKITNTIVLNVANKKLYGLLSNMFNYVDNNLVSCIHPAFNGIAVKVGYDALPLGGAGNNLSKCEVKHLTIAFDENNNYTEATGIKSSYNFTCIFEDIMILNAVYGYYIVGNVNTRFNNCRSYRNTTDNVISSLISTVYGFYVDSLQNIGLAGGNASLFFNECNATFTIGITTCISYGFYVIGAIADIFMDKCETSGGTSGIDFVATGTSLASNSDVKITNCICDGANTFALHIASNDTVIRDCLIDVVNFWGALIASANNTGSVIEINYIRGVNISNGCINSLNNERGIFIQNSKQITVTDVKCSLGTYGVAISNVDHSNISVIGVGCATPLYVISGGYLLLKCCSIGGTNINIAGVLVPQSVMNSMDDYIVDTVRLLAPISI